MKPFPLPSFSAIDGPNGMNDVFRWELVGRSDLGRTGVAATECFAFVEQIGSSCGVYGPVLRQIRTIFEISEPHLRHLLRRVENYWPR